jgi:AcrR family transcriptional regulator
MPLLSEQGHRPTVAEVADAALVSRATAYRYFPTQEYLLFEAALGSTRSDIDRELDKNTLPQDPEARLEVLIDTLQKRIVDKEPAFRTMPGSPWSSPRKKCSMAVIQHRLGFGEEGGSAG